MDYFAGLDIPMDETHVCVLDREGVVVCASGRQRTGQGAKLSSDRTRDRTHGAAPDLRIRFDVAFAGWSRLERPDCAISQISLQCRHHRFPWSHEGDMAEHKGLS